MAGVPRILIVADGCDGSLHGGTLTAYRHAHADFEAAAATVPLTRTRT